MKFTHHDSIGVGIAFSSTDIGNGFYLTIASADGKLCKIPTPGMILRIMHLSTC